MIKNIKNIQGFTLVELLIAVGIFTIVVSIAAGGFINALRSERQISALMVANTNVALALEQMTREIRTGFYFCRAAVTDCTNYPNEIVFINAKGEQIGYRLTEDNTIERDVTDINTGLTAATKITGSNAKIEYLNFVISGNISDDTIQSRITISVGVSAKTAGVSQNIINLQTTVSPRELDS